MDVFLELLLDDFVQHFRLLGHRPDQVSAPEFFQNFQGLEAVQVHVFGNHGQRRSIVEQSDKFQHLLLGVRQGAAAGLKNVDHIFRQIIQAAGIFKGRQAFLQKENISLRLLHQAMDQFVGYRHLELRLLSKKPHHVFSHRFQVQSSQFLVHTHRRLKLLESFFLGFLGSQEKQQPGGFLVKNQGA